MSLNKSALERQLDRAKQELGVWVKSLETKGVSGDSRRRDPRWRTLNARCRQIESRIATVVETARINSETEARKAQKLAAAEAPEEPPAEAAPKTKSKKASKGEAAEGAAEPKSKSKESKPKEPKAKEPKGKEPKAKAEKASS